MTKVCHITTVHDHLDDRIFYKECVSLSRAGYEVYLVATYHKKETIDGVHLVPLPQSKGRLHRMFIKSHFAFYRALKTKSKVYHIHDPELLLVGVLLRIIGKKVIYDSHENVSKQIESKEYIKSFLVKFMVAKSFRLFEKICIAFFSSVISVTPEIVEFLSNKKGVLLRNFPIISLIDEAKPNEKKEDKLVLFYAGGLSRIRGIKEVCEAVAKSELNVEFQIAGPWESEEYRKECLAICPTKTYYLGVFPMEEIYPMMKAADVGIATLFPVKNYLNSYPIKAFEYMACGIPILMSDFPYWMQSFGDYALFVDPNSPQDIGSKIDYLLSNPKEAKQMGESGRKAVMEKYSWEAESKKLVDLYKTLI